VNRFPRLLSVITLAYLALPLFLFCIGWARPVYAVALVGCLVVCLWRALRDGVGMLAPAGSYPADLASWRLQRGALLRLLLGIGLIVLWVSLSGAGGFGYQNPDWLNGRNNVLHDLMVRPWPVFYGLEHGQPRPLVYGIACFLPAALLGKLGSSWSLACQGVYAWTLAGVLLTYAWLVRLTGAGPLLCAVLFIFFSGMDIVGSALLGADIGVFRHLENWANGWQFTSMTTLLYWAPNHALGGWLLVCLFMAEAMRRRCDTLLFLLCLSGLWSPYAGLGLVPFALVAGYQSRGKSVFSVQNIAALPVAVFLGLYFLSTDATAGQTGWIGHFRDMAADWPVYILFIVLEYGLLALILRAVLPELRQPGWMREFFLIACLALAIFPLYKLGGDVTHELCMRASIPAFFFLLYCTCRALTQSKAVRRTATYGLLALMLVLGAFTPSTEMLRSVYFVIYCGIGLTPDIPAPLSETAAHYVGSPYSTFFRYLAKTPVE